MAARACGAEAAGACVTTKVGHSLRWKLRGWISRDIRCAGS
ncbi:hypothetical protein [Paenibacillus dendritiformis]|nr:hypothetical protein [Paenibacillus dendritiformis]